MGSSQNCVYCHKIKRHIVSLLLLLLLLLLLISNLSQVTLMAEGRAISKLVEPAQKGMEEEKNGVVRSMIGSRPPKCERMCSSCRNCEAIQVPVTTKAPGHKATHFSAIAYSRGDDSSNYKPMSWKCKCGNLIFNP